MLRSDDVKAYEAFVVKDWSLNDVDAPFFKWLEDNGFKKGFIKGHYGCDWVFVSITHKLFAYGMPGVQIVTETGGHAITIEEFFVVWKIFAKYKGLDLLAMCKEEQKERETERYYVRVQNSGRDKLFEFLNSEGFTCESDNRNVVVQSYLPFSINVTEKCFGVIGNITCAAAAALSRRIIEDVEFYVLYKKSRCTYEEYLEAVKYHFIEYRYTENEMKAYFERPDTLDILNDSYADYVKYNSPESYPVAIASCLDMLY